MIRTNCQNCSRFFAAPQQMLEQGVNCPHCHAQVLKHYRPSQSHDPNNSSQLSLREQLKRYRVGFEKSGDSILIVQKKLERGDKVPFLVAAYVSFLVLNYVLTYVIGFFALSSLAFLISLPLVFILAIYFAIVHEVNRTLIKIDRNEIAFRDDGPLPWPKFMPQTRISTRRIKQFFVNTVYSPGGENTSASLTDSLSVVLDDDSQIRLVSLERGGFFRWIGAILSDGSEDWRSGYVERLLGLETLIENHLGIEDQQVVSTASSTTTYGSRAGRSSSIQVGEHSETPLSFFLSIGLIFLMIFSLYVSRHFIKANKMLLAENRRIRVQKKKELAFEEIYSRIFKAPPAEVVAKLPVHMIDRALQNAGFTLKRMTDLVPRRNIKLYQPPDQQETIQQCWFVVEHTKETPSFFQAKKLSEHEFQTEHLFVRHAFPVRIAHGQRPQGMFFVSHETDTNRQLQIAYLVPDHVSATCLFLREIIERHNLPDEKLRSKELYDWILKECQREYLETTVPVTEKNSFKSSSLDLSTLSHSNSVKPGNEVALLKNESLTLKSSSTMHLPMGTNFRVAKIEDDKVWGDGLFPLKNKIFAKKAADVAFSPDGQKVVSVGQDNDSNGKIVVWNLKKGTLESLERKGGVKNVGFEPGGNGFFVSDYYGRVVHSWNLEKLTFNFGFRTPQRPRDMAFSSDGSFLVIGESGYHPNKQLRYFGPCDVSMWSIKEKKRIARLQGNERSVHAVDISSDDSFVVSAGKDKKIRIYNKSKKALRTWATSHLVNDILFIANDTRIASTGDGGDVHINDAKTGDLESKLEFSDGKGLSLAVSPDEKLIACTDSAGMLRIWSLKTNELLLEQQVSQSRVVGLDFSPGGQRIVTASEDGVVAIWHIGSGKGLSGWVPADSLIK